MYCNPMRSGAIQCEKAPFQQGVAQTRYPEYAGTSRIGIMRFPARLYSGTNPSKRR